MINEIKLKLCSTCKSLKALEDFNKYTRSKDGKKPHCRECGKKKGKDWYASDRERIRNKFKEWSSNNKIRIREYKLTKNYGMTTLDYDRMYQIQQGKCAICSKHSTEFKTRLAVDHDHITGKVRGLLCHNCNKGLGIFSDSVDLLEKAFNYIKR